MKLWVLLIGGIILAIIGGIMLAVALSDGTPSVKYVQVKPQVKPEPVILNLINLS